MFSKELFSSRLQELRLEKDLSVKEAAELFGAAKTTYFNWENCSREAPYEALSRIADYFEVTTDYLLGRTDCRGG